MHRAPSGTDASRGSGDTSEVVVSHPAHQHAYETAVGAQRAGLLRWFVTGLYDKGVAERIVRGLPTSAARPLDRELRRRWHPALDPEKVVTFPRHAAVAAGFRRAAGRRFISQSERLEIWSQTGFDRRVGSWLSRGDPPRIIHAFEGAALATFQAARQVSVTTVLDVPSAHEDYVETLKAEQRTSHAFSLDRVREERRLADFLVAPSEYVVNCLVRNGVPSERIVIVPYGVDVSTFRRVIRKSEATFRVLFVGQIGVRKGVKYLIEAWRSLALTRAELVLVGQPDAFGQRLLSDLPASCRWVGAVPKHEVHEWFRHCDAFVLPTLAEAWGLVVTEAMASGLPVVTTTACGAPVRNGRDGFVIPARSSEALREKLRLLYDDRDLCSEMGSNGRTLVERHYTWQHYHSRIARAYELILRKENPAKIQSENAKS